jgi:phosphatidylserine/phosphatidylglycerophosphate/cardiolipin synthase-like enzyme
MKKKVLQKTEISPTIISEMEKSESEIIVVSAWFTDEDILNVLIKKQEQGVKVKLIVEDNIENEKYRFSRLIKAGGEVYKIKKEDFGIMHKKYCIIDEKIAVFPLAIRSPYYLLNDHESLIVTDHYKTAQNLKTHFYKIKENATTIAKDNIVNSILTHFKNLLIGILNIKIKSKEAETIKEIDFERNIKPAKRINLKMINPATIFEDESGDIFLNRN